MVKQFRNRPGLIASVGLLALALGIWLALMREFRLDDSFITYRYARNLMRGWGLVYNQGDAVLSTTAPLYAILLGILSLVIADFHSLGGLVGAVCIGLGGGVMAQLLPRHTPPGIRLWAGLLYGLSSPLWLALGMETPLWILLVLAAIWLSQTERWRWAGLCVGLAVLARPDAALPGLLLGLLALWTTLEQLGTRRHPWLPLFSYGLMAALPVAVFVIWAWLTYGSPFPVTLGAKSAQALLGITGLGVNVTYVEGLKLVLSSLMAQSPLYIAFTLLALFGLADRLSGPVKLAVAWGLLHLAAYVVLGVAPYRWYYAPLLPGIILLVACGLDYIQRRLALRQIRLRPALIVGLAIFPVLAQANTFQQVSDRFQRGGPSDVMLPVVDWGAYRQVGDWLRAQTPETATIGVAEVGQVGFYADRPMTDYLGLLQPDVAAMLRRGDLYSWLVGYAPDYLVFQRFRGAPLVLYNHLIGGDAWFQGHYQPVTEFDDPRYSSGPVTIFARVQPLKPLKSQAVQLDYGGIRLVGLALDGYDVSAAGGPVRVRLDWQVMGELPADLHIAVKPFDVPSQPSFDGDYQTARWVGDFSTWHGFVLPENVKPGGYKLLVAVGPKGGPYQEQIASLVDVSFPKASIGDGITFTRDNEPQLRLLQHTVKMDGNALVGDWTWQAEQDLAADYIYFVHLRPEGETQPLMQADSQPLAGSYPTRLWQRGEIVPMQFALDKLPTQPGSYDVLAGWYTPGEGQRLKLADGRAELRIAQVLVSSSGSAIIAQVSD